MPPIKSRMFRSLLVICAATRVAAASAVSNGVYPSTLDLSTANSGFHHGVTQVNGVKLHYVESGMDKKGDPILLIPGWPQSWYAWRFIMPKLVAAGHRVVAIDLRGMGDSDHPMEGYDSQMIAADVHAFVQARGLARDGRLHVAGHDVGAWMAYAYAADWPQDVKTLTVMEAALPGITPPAPAGIPSDDGNLRSWHFAFNRIPDLPEILVQGHERAYLEWLFAQKSVNSYVFTPEALDEYTRVFAQPGGSRAAFSYYRAAFSEGGLQQNRRRAGTKLPMPVLAVGGQYSVGEGMLKTMMPIATDARGIIIPNAGHFVLEEKPSEVAEAMLKFMREDHHAQQRK